jgi:hypothetical protein
LYGGIGASVVWPPKDHVRKTRFHRGAGLV